MLYKILTLRSSRFWPETPSRTQKNYQMKKKRQLYLRQKYNLSPLKVDQKK